MREFWYSLRELAVDFLNWLKGGTPDDDRSQRSSLG